MRLRPPRRRKRTWQLQPLSEGCSVISLPAALGSPPVKRRPSQLFLERVGMIMQPLEWVLGAAERPSKPRQDLLLLKPLTPRRILGAADVLDHREIAQAQNATGAAIFSRPSLVLPTTVYPKPPRHLEPSCAVAGSASLAAPGRF